ncbi:peptidoglycan D,D-transpeptidase FtsI family protein [Paenibacillus pinistramenti]|uniref:peptidoglycan D,D-transpeptidase FtsI family protein n=1 Tax=Paenibacillus pinistramenti TaxID=1768003 RepID=UPI0011082315|nr:penicillin-binding transpeptidase domain-containing protein [Paenibacillus pinistramenti]
MNLTMKKRIFICLLLLSSAIAVMHVRLAWLQLLDGVPKAASAHGRVTSEMAVRQRESRIELDSGRGRFVDAAGLPLTNEVVMTPVLFPVRSREESGQLLIQNKELQSLAQLLKTTPDHLQEIHSRLQHPVYWTEQTEAGVHIQDSPLHLSADQVTRIEGLKISWIKVLPLVQRYAYEPSGKQWLGFLAEQPELVEAANKKSADKGQKREEALSVTAKLGAAGLEKTFDRIIRGEGATGISYRMDAGHQPMSKDDLRIHTSGNPYYPLTVQTTIDLPLQNRIERLAAAKGVKEGAVVILDAVNGDIKAMVSLPFYNPNQVDPQNLAAWSNRAVKEAVPGSIFKTVTAAAALEAGITAPNEAFMCLGSYGKYGLSCWKKGGHGHITLAQAFAESCNTVFGQLGERLPPAMLQQTADALGLGRTIGWQAADFMNSGPLRQIDQEESGTVFGGEAHPEDGGVRAQTAIGQRSARMSPLQAANLVVTLLHGGAVQAPRLVSGIFYANGTEMIHFKPHKSPGQSGQISANTAAAITEWMRSVVTDGTGRRLSHSKWHLAGKSGTAQVTRNGRALNDQWFIGYGPYESPQYAAAVLVQSREPGSVHLATELFGEIMDELAEMKDQAGGQRGKSLS